MPSSGRRVQARVALALLEAVRDRDQPGERLDDENVSVTLPRRFGLSEVVDSQIRRYRHEARRGRRIPEPEVRDLIRLVARRPDASRVFHEVGRSLTVAEGAPAWRRVLPERFVLDMARKRIRRRLSALFGGEFLFAARGPFQLTATRELLVEADPKGGACALVAGLSQAVVDVYGSTPRRVSHVACRARGDGQCIWELAEPARGNGKGARSGGGDSAGDEDGTAGKENG